MKCLILLFLVSFNVWAAEPAWWTKQKRDCGLSPSLAYVTWRDQGLPCKKESGSGVAAPASPSVGTELGTTLGNAYVDGIRASQERTKILETQIQTLRVEAARKKAIEDEEQKNRILDELMDVGPDTSFTPEPGSALGLMNNDEPIEKTVRALDCAVATILDQAKEITVDDLGSELQKLKQQLRAPLSGANDTITIQTISLSDIKIKGSAEKEIFGSIIVTRNEHSGMVHIDVMQSSSKPAGFISKMFGKRASTKSSQNLMAIDSTGKIMASDLTKKVRNCLNSR